MIYKSSEPGANVMDQETMIHDISFEESLNGKKYKKECKIYIEAGTLPMADIFDFCPRFINGGLELQYYKCHRHNLLR